MILTHEFLRSQPRNIYGAAFESVGNQILNENTRMYKANQSFDVFLSHSSLDQSEVLNLISLTNVDTRFMSIGSLTSNLTEVMLLQKLLKHYE